MKLAPVLVACSFILIACADPPEPTDESLQNSQTDVAQDVAEVVCEAGGAIRVLDPRVRAQPDGLHVRVEVSLDGPVQLDGLWLDEPVQPGRTDVVTLNPPGTLTLACWPVSQLESSSFEPDRAELAVLDPDGVYVSDQLECLPGDETAGWTVDFDENGPDIEPPITPLEAEAALRRLEPGDLVARAGYPEGGDDHIAVVRGGRTIAVMLFFHGQDGIESYDGGICKSEAVLPPGIE